MEWLLLLCETPRCEAWGRCGGCGGRHAPASVVCHKRVCNSMRNRMCNRMVSGFEVFTQLDAFAFALGLQQHVSVTSDHTLAYPYPSKKLLRNKGT